MNRLLSLHLAAIGTLNFFLFGIQATGFMNGRYYYITKDYEKPLSTASSFQASNSFVGTRGETELCKAGNYLDTGRNCLPCPLGTYLILPPNKPKECDRCLDGKTTLNIGTKNPIYCVDPADTSVLRMGGDEEEVSVEEHVDSENSTSSSTLPSDHVLVPSTREVEDYPSTYDSSYPYLGVGYNIKFGMPLGSTISPMDPGFTQPILDIVDGKVYGVLTSNLKLVEIPVYSLSVASCMRSHQTEIIRSVKDYQSSVDRELAVVSGVSSTIVKAGFKCTSDFKSFKKVVLDQLNELVSTTSYCVKTQTGLAVTDDKLVSRIEGEKGEIELKPIDAIKNLILLSDLPNRCETPEEKNAWFSFFNSVGTHIVIAVESGGKMIERKLVNKNKGTVDDNKKNVMNAGITAETIIGSLNSSINASQSKVFHDVDEGVRNLEQATVRYIGGIPPSSEAGSSTLDTFSQWSQTVDDHPMPIRYRVVSIDALIGVNSDTYVTALACYLELSEQRTKKIQSLGVMDNYGSYDMKTNGIVISDSIVAGEMFIPSKDPLVLSDNGEVKVVFTPKGTLEIYHDTPIDKGMIKRGVLFDSSDGFGLNSDEIEDDIYQQGCWPQSYSNPEKNPVVPNSEIKGENFPNYGLIDESNNEACTSWVMVFGTDGDLCILKWIPGAQPDDGFFEYRWCTNTYYMEPNCDTKCPAQIHKYVTYRSNRKAYEDRVCTRADTLTIRDNGELVLHEYEVDYENDPSKWMWRSATAVYDKQEKDQDKVGNEIWYYPSHMVRGIRFGEGQNNCVNKNKLWENESKGGRIMLRAKTSAKRSMGKATAKVKQIFNIGDVSEEIIEKFRPVDYNQIINE